MALINSWVSYCQVNNSNISHHVFIQKVSEELTGFAEQYPIPTPLASIQEKVHHKCHT